MQQVELAAGAAAFAAAAATAVGEGRQVGVAGAAAATAQAAAGAAAFAASASAAAAAVAAAVALPSMAGGCCWLHCSPKPQLVSRSWAWSASWRAKPAFLATTLVQKRTIQHNNK